MSLTVKEIELIINYRLASKSGKKLIKRLAKALDSRTTQDHGGQILHIPKTQKVKSNAKP